jgi:hypothetical protein
VGKAEKGEFVLGFLPIWKWGRWGAYDEDFVGFKII